MNHRIGMSDIWQEFLQNILRLDLQAGGVDTGMTAYVGVIGYYLFINQQFYLVLTVIHQAQNANGAWGDIQKPLHKLWLRKR